MGLSLGFLCFVCNLNKIWDTIYGGKLVDVLKACVQVPILPYEPCDGVWVHVCMLVWC